MRLNIEEFLREAEINEAFYPGKRLIHECRQAGEYKSHCIVLDWRDPSKIRIEIKAGLTGRDLDPKKLKYYPVCFQSPSHIDIEIVNDNQADDEDETEGSASGSRGKGGGGKKPAKKKKIASIMESNAFSSASEGTIPALGKITEMLIMGKEMAEEAYGRVMGKLANQIKHAKVSATDLLAQAGNYVTRYMPPSFMKPVGDEQATYKYDREKNADIGYTRALSPG